MVSRIHDIPSVSSFFDNFWTIAPTGDGAQLHTAAAQCSNPGKDAEKDIATVGVVATYGPVG